MSCERPLLGLPSLSSTLENTFGTYSESEIILPCFILTLLWTIACFVTRGVQARIASVLQTGAPWYPVLRPFHILCLKWIFFFLGNKASAHELPLSLSQLKFFLYTVSWKGFSNGMGVLVRNWNAGRGGEGDVSHKLGQVYGHVEGGCF